jgi:hypothetical protein
MCGRRKPASASYRTFLARGEALNRAVELIEEENPNLVGVRQASLRIEDPASFDDEFAELLQVFFDIERSVQPNGQA